MIDQLGVDAETALAHEQVQIDQATQELTSLESGQNDEIDKLGREILELERHLSEINQPLQSLQSQQGRLTSDVAAAQRNLASCEAKIEQNIKAGSADVTDIERRLAEQATALQQKTGVAIDYSSRASIQSIESQQQSNLSSARQALESDRKKLAVSASNLSLHQARQPREKLKNTNTAIAEIAGYIDTDRLQMTTAQASQAVNAAQSELQESTTLLNTIEGQLQIKQVDLQQSLPSAAAHESDCSLIDLKQTLANLVSSMDSNDMPDPRARQSIAESLTALNTTREDLNQQVTAQNHVTSELDAQLKAQQVKAGQSAGKLEQLRSTASEQAKIDAQHTIDKVLQDSGGALDKTRSLQEQLNDIKSRLTTAKRNSSDSQKLLNQVRGKLESVGGSMLSEQVRRQRESVAHLHNEAADFEKTCEAEKYLHDVMYNFSEQNSAHLGRVLGTPVSHMFKQLTDSRYGDFSLDPTLTAKGIKVDGESRDYQQLSIGTRQQLAVLVRLALAAQLKCTLVLDDQLVQSDPARLAWFRDAFRSSASEHRHQIIIITCRPEDYQAPFTGDGYHCSVDLSTRVKRVSAGTRPDRTIAAPTLSTIARTGNTKPGIPENPTAQATSRASKHHTSIEYIVTPDTNDLSGEWEVWETKVRIGDIISPSQVVVTIGPEGNKPVLATCVGTVVEIHVTAGDFVAPGDRLVSIKPYRAVDRIAETSIHSDTPPSMATDTDVLIEVLDILVKPDQRIAAGDLLIRGVDEYGTVKLLNAKRAGVVTSIDLAGGDKLRATEIDDFIAIT